MEAWSKWLFQPLGCCCCKIFVCFRGNEASRGGGVVLTDFPGGVDCASVAVLVVFVDDDDDELLSFASMTVQKSADEYSASSVLLLVAWPSSRKDTEEEDGVDGETGGNE